MSAVRKTSADLGLDVAMVDAPSPTFEAATDAVQTLQRSGATAVIAFNDQMALGVIAGLVRLGLSVPGDLSVIGIDDVPMAAMVAPSLTTVSLPSEDAGAAAVALLREGRSAKTELFGTLVVRESTGRVTRRRANAGVSGARRPSGADHG